jgi:hypothetical protein
MLHRSELDGFRYSRFDVEHRLGKVKLDTWKEKQGTQTLKLIRTKTREYLRTSDVKRNIDEVTMRLVQYRFDEIVSRQPNSNHWEAFFVTSVEYSCLCPNMCRLQKGPDLKTFDSILQNVHSFNRSTNRETHSICCSSRVHELYHSTYNIHPGRAIRVSRHYLIKE